MFNIQDILVAGLCFLAVGKLVENPNKYTHIVRGVFISAFVVTCIAVLVDLVLPIRAVRLIAGTGLCLVEAVVFMLSPSTDWPHSYVWSLRLGWAMAFLALCSMTGIRMGFIHPSFAFCIMVGVVGLGSLALLLVARMTLRPKDRPRNGVW